MMGNLAQDILNNSSKVNMLKDKYLHSTNIMQHMSPTSTSSAWKAIMQALYFLRDGYAWKAGDSHRIFFQDDQWIGDRPLRDMAQHIETEDERILVYNVMVGNSTWELTRLRTPIHKEIKEKILAILLTYQSTSSDKII